MGRSTELHRQYSKGIERLLEDSSIYFKSQNVQCIVVEISRMKKEIAGVNSYFCDFYVDIPFFQTPLAHFAQYIEEQYHEKDYHAES
jgi:hypothetical protein